MKVSTTYLVKGVLYEVNVFKDGSTVVRFTGDGGKASCSGYLENLNNGGTVFPSEAAALSHVLQMVQDIECLALEGASK